MTIKYMVLLMTVLYLYRIEPAVAIQWKANNMGWILVPAGVDWIAHDIPGLWENLFYEGLVPTDGNPLAQVRGHPHHQALAGLSRPPLLPVLFPALQLFHHGRQLVEPSLLVQQLELLQGQHMEVNVCKER